MKTFVKKKWKLLIIILVLVIFGARINQRFFAEKPLPEEKVDTVVDLFTLQDSLNESIDMLCQVEPVSEVAITPEFSGSITKVLVDEGTEVEEDDILFEIENIQQRVAVADAKVALESARLSLKDLQDQNNSFSENSIVNQTQKQQDTIVAEALNNLFNNDLQVYPEDNPDTISKAAPSVIGSYTCSQEGEYAVEVYASSGLSGGSFRYAGLESGTSTVSVTDFGTPLGDCGLELVFPEGFDKSETWIIPVPNTRSNSYQSIKNAYETALKNRDLALNQAEASPEIINQAKGRVDQARLRYQLALDNLNKTIVRAKIDGVVSGFDLDVGDYVSAFEDLGNIKTTDYLEIVGYLNVGEQQYVNDESVVRIGEEESTIKSISKTIDSVTRKSKITINAPENLTLVEGESLACSVERITDAVVRSDGGVIIPLSALSIIGVDPYVFTLDESNITVLVPVRVGAILGTHVVVYGELPEFIIKDARGIRADELVELTDK